MRKLSIVTICYIAKLESGIAEGHAHKSREGSLKLLRLLTPNPLLAHSRIITQIIIINALGTCVVKQDNYCVI